MAEKVTKNKIPKACPGSRVVEGVATDYRQGLRLLQYHVKIKKNEILQEFKI